MRLDRNPNWDEVRVLVTRSFCLTAGKRLAALVAELPERGGSVTLEREVASGDD